MQVARHRPTISGAAYRVALVSGLRDAWSWWKSELWDMAPGMLRSLVGERRKSLVVAIDGDELTATIESSGEREELCSGSSSGDEADRLADRIRAFLDASPATTLVARLPPGQVHQIVTELPAVSRSELGRLIELNLSRLTPFRASEVHWGWEIAGTTPDRKRLSVRLSLAKRASVAACLGVLERLRLTPATVDGWDKSGSAVLPPLQSIEPSESRQAGAPFLRPSRVWAACGVLLLLAVFQANARQRTALDALDAKIETARIAAARSRDAVQRAEVASEAMAQLRAHKVDRPSFVDILEEISRILPDDAWLSELRLESGDVELVGHARRAGSLLQILETSQVFREATLNAPVVLDAKEDRERFAIRMKLRKDGSAGVSSMTEVGK